MAQPDVTHEREWIVLTIVFYLVMGFLIVLAGYAVYTTAEYSESQTPVRSRHRPTTAESIEVTPAIRAGVFFFDLE